ncbi:Asp-tRNAAsn/Glu-tRNAGln amidotransferase A subunit and related amidase [Rubrobacter radiotolerans]|uniref:Amidase n=1 Tax=Rubrobacter radiotolerans TaxID=42256 RepID=A0A023WYQ3_RUBRA|nr:amidase [Rubrobacter radiotolerans]AHY45362.1 Asp-tRNAAsn/Glu-tRNAGln amidotransferase A subunit and related amidase [Rubrobacter radiotolerans]MDX5892773.1 amidase [Rubrobacter radiotolerans]SMC02471.1 amidase [Rubrobacter radiotolerans DSM 5868]
MICAKTPDREILYASAADLARRIREREVSCAEVMEAHLRRIEAVNGRLNALVTLHPERSLEDARAADRRLSKGESVGPLHGLPVAHKDLLLTSGVRTTFGSTVFRDHVPEVDSLSVERLRRAGAISVGKTNTPEFGAGSQTFNALFGATRNPYDPRKTCGGSSGGAAVALASGMVPLADGSDMGGSLRNPAAFCNVFGLRPSVGRVPVWPSRAAFSRLSVEGPMARSARDAALMLAATAGPDRRDPLSLEAPGSAFLQSLERDFSGARLAFVPNPRSFPVEPAVCEVVEGSRVVFEGLGCAVEDAEPDFSGADGVFKTLRAWHFELEHGGLLDAHREELKETVVWNIEEGRRLAGSDLGAAERERAGLYRRTLAFMERYEFLVLPTVQVAPFGVEEPFVREINGLRMETYIDWMKSCYFITATGLPAASVPGGFTKAGLPVGVQIVGRPRDDLGVLRLAHAFEQATRYGERRPELT